MTLFVQFIAHSISSAVYLVKRFVAFVAFVMDFRLPRSLRSLAKTVLTVAFVAFVICLDPSLRSG